MHVKCVRGNQYDDLYLLEMTVNKIIKNKTNKLILKIKNKQNKQKERSQKNYNLKFSKAKQIDTIQSYINFLKKYPNSKKGMKSLFYVVKKENIIKDYMWFIKKYPKASQKKDAINNLYTLVDKQKNILGYEWFIQEYPKAPQTKNAVRSIHSLAYNKAKQINTLSAYNTFIIAYPYASQLNVALEKSFALETAKYTNMKKDDEKKARILAVKVKKMTIRMKKSNAKIGYEIVIDRMTRLLTDKYEETDASLRYYESKEFTDFTLKFDKSMNGIKRVLNKIANNTADISSYSKKMLDISAQGFADSKADREMAKYKNDEHHKWNRRMHLMEKGYN